MLTNPNAPTTVSPDNPLAVMQRRELKYLLSPEQEAHLRLAMREHVVPDQFARSSIASLYYDSPDYRLIRASLERPLFKEKLRLRSYGPATEHSPVFLELKRKAAGIVYKRRVQTTLRQADAFVVGAAAPCEPCQISRELCAFRDHYGNLAPACMILYERTAFVEPGGSLRLTIDNNTRYRMEHLTMTHPMEGRLLLPSGWSILELKIQDAMPLWLSRALSEAKIYKTSFSKYGEAYRLELQQRAMRSAS